MRPSRSSTGASTRETRRPLHRQPRSEHRNRAPVAPPDPSTARRTLAPYRCNATLTAKGREVNAKSIVGVMLLAAGHGTPGMLRVEGEDEAAAVDALVALFERRFDEEN